MCVFRLFLIARYIIIVLTSCKPCQSIVIDIESQGINTSDRYIDPQIELIAIEQQGVINILTDNVGTALIGNLCKFICHDNAFALRGGRGLCDPELVFVSLHFGFQVHEFVWKQVGLWNEVEVLLTVNFTHL